MKFVDELLKEYVNGGKIDISEKVLKRMKKNKMLKDTDLQSQYLATKRADKFCIKVQAFLSDLFLMFSDFDEQEWETLEM